MAGIRLSCVLCRRRVLSLPKSAYNKAPRKTWAQMKAYIAGYGTASTSVSQRSWFLGSLVIAPQHHKAGFLCSCGLLVANLTRFVGLFNTLLSAEEMINRGNDTKAALWTVRNPLDHDCTDAVAAHAPVLSLNSGRDCNGFWGVLC